MTNLSRYNYEIHFLRIHHFSTVNLIRLFMQNYASFTYLHKVFPDFPCLCSNAYIFSSPKYYSVLLKNIFARPGNWLEFTYCTIYETVRWRKSCFLFFFFFFFFFNGYIYYDMRQNKQTNVSLTIKYILDILNVSIIYIYIYIFFLFCLATRRFFGGKRKKNPWVGNNL